ncbi:MAG: hypothetical protein BM557_07475 [Flavobacterium sp. MedPE-SWcel]|uniref:DUF4249 domain-containing protein n=1 Tax=uncultured Flavobacterium sp. TaxID=165435 RepID=UPI0009122AE0|nr:DUF4249 domain-containing protein [uncultured Flavobacterium sp.]OIQ18048.1 MAG: hypothetical protein BM557_07475 [Flavobacterium sp. MedPE-SWcel]
MKNIKLIILVLTGVLFTACEETVDIDLDTAEPRLVVEASIDWIKGTDGSQQVVKLSTTTGYYENVVPVVSNANVFITNSSNNTIFGFTEIPDTGHYISNSFVPVIGDTYVLTVEYNNETYTATETFYPVPEIKRIEQTNDGGFTGEDIEVRFFFDDNGEGENNYLTRFDTEAYPFPEYDVSDNEFFSGNEMFNFIDNEDFAAGQEVSIKLYGISRRYANFMDIVSEVNEGESSGGPFGTTPVAVRGNLINQTNPDNHALGYFRLCEVDEEIYIIE